MPSAKNIQQVKDLKEKLGKAKSVVLTNYRGLSVDQINDLRRKIKKAGGELKVAKNTLLKISFKDLKFKTDDLKEALTEPTAILFSYQDELSPIKALYQFCQENELPEIKLGFLEKELFTKDKIIDLAKLPALETLQAKLVATINSPLYGLVYVLKANLQGLTRVLSQIKTGGEKNG